MIRFFILLTGLCFSLYASTIENKIIKFENDRFSKNTRIEVQTISVVMKKSLPVKGWYGFIVEIEALMAGKNVKAKDIVFSDGKIVSSELFDLDTSKSYKDLMNPTLSSKYYDKSKLIAGTHNAKDKIVVFSDPLCPFCIDFLPDVINYVKKHPKKIALYYYNFPLVRHHPAALPLSKLSILAKNKGIKDIELKVYTRDWDKYFTSKEKDEEKIIKAFNSEFMTNFTKKDIDNKTINDEIVHDMDMGEDVMVQGTPTVFINGEIDKTRIKYESLGK